MLWSGIWKPMTVGWTFTLTFTTLKYLRGEHYYHYQKMVICYFICRMLGYCYFISSLQFKNALLFCMMSPQSLLLSSLKTILPFSLSLPASGKRQSIMLFTCDQSAGHGTPQLLSETAGCSATFQWRTDAVCPPRKMQCKLVSQHQTFNLRTLSSLTEPWKFSHQGDS